MFPIELQQREFSSAELGYKIDGCGRTKAKIERRFLRLAKARVIVLGRRPILDLDVTAQQAEHQTLGDPLTSVLRGDPTRREIQQQE
jgi:hypothetical protein